MVWNSYKEDKISVFYENVLKFWGKIHIFHFRIFKVT